jgi:hypothetical protein
MSADQHYQFRFKQGDLIVEEFSIPFQITFVLVVSYTNSIDDVTFIGNIDTYA